MSHVINWAIIITLVVLTVINLSLQKIYKEKTLCEIESALNRIELAVDKALKESQND